MTDKPAPVVIREWPAAAKDSFREALTEEHNAAIRALRAEVEALKTDRANFAREIHATRDQLQAAEAQAAALRGYARHKPGCGFETISHEYKCTCGLSAALEPRK